MNIEEVRNLIKEINRLDALADFEIAHSKEDELVWAFIYHVADPDNHDFATNNAIATELIDFMENSEGHRFFS